MAKALFFFTVIFSWACHAGDGDIRPLRVVFLEAEVVLEGAMVGSGIGECGGKEGVNSFYFIRITEVISGDVEKKDIKACGAAPLLLGDKYLVAADKYSDDEIVFEPDSVFLEFPTSVYYRLISYDSPIVLSSDGQVYAVGVLESDLLKVMKDVIPGADKK